MSIYSRTYSQQRMSGTRHRGVMEPRAGVGADPLVSFVTQGVGPRLSATLATCHRIPILYKAANGDYLCFVDCRSGAGAQDNTGYAIVVFRSTDGGYTWGSANTVYSHSAFNSNTDWIAGGGVVCDYASTKYLYYFYTRATGAAGAATNHAVYVTVSTDHGVTWGAPTDITANVKVTDGTHPANHQFPATAWTHCVPTGAGIQLKSGAAAGRMLVPFDHRITDFSTGSVSKSHCIVSNDNGTTWGLFTSGGCGGVNQASATNDGSNECSITETQTAGRLVMHIRNVATGTTRYQSVSTDSGATWSDIAALTNLSSPSVWGDVKQCKHATIACYPGDRATTIRNTLCLAVSTDQGATWPAATSRLQIGCSYAGYSSMLVDGDKILVAYEAGGGNPASGSIPDYCAGVRLFRTNLRWVLNPTLRYAQHFYNEEASGVAGMVYGTYIPDYGNMDLRVLTGTAAAPPTYSSTGIDVSAGTADKITICAADNTCLDFAAGDSFTIEVEASITGNGIIAGKFNASTGWKLESATGKLKATIADGTTTITCNGATGVNTTITDGVRRVYSMVRNKSAGTLAIYLNGTLEKSVSDTTSASLVQTGVAAIIGDNSGGTAALAATIHSDRFTRGVAQNLLSAPVTKASYATLRNITAPSLSFPALTGSALPKLWLFQTYNNGLDAFGDIYTTERYRYPIPVGSAVRSIIDGDARRRRWFGSEGARSLVANDAYMGPCYDMDWISGVTRNGSLSNAAAFGATNGFDFVQNTGTFTICFCVNFKASTTTYQMVLDNNDAGSTAVGFNVWRNDGASVKLTLSVGNGTTTQFNETIAGGPALSYGSTYFLALVGQGASQPVKLYYSQITNAYSASSPVQPTVSVATSSANFGAAGTYPTTATLHVGGRTTTGDKQLNAYIKNVMIFNVSLAASDMDKLALYNVSG